MNYTFLNSHLKFNTTQKVIDQIDAAIVLAALQDIEIEVYHHHNRFVESIDWGSIIESILHFDDYKNLCRIDLYKGMERLHSFDQGEDNLVHAFEILMTYL